MDNNRDMPLRESDPAPNSSNTNIIDITSIHKSVKQLTKSKSNKNCDESSVSEWGDEDDLEEEDIDHNENGEGGGNHDIVAEEEDEDEDEEEGIGSTSTTYTNGPVGGTTTTAATTFQPISPRLQIILSWSWILCAIFMPAGLYGWIRHSEMQRLEYNFDSLADQFVNQVDVRIKNMMNAMDDMSMATTFQALRLDRKKNSSHDAKSWPFVTLDDFDQQGTDALALARTLQLGWSPLVQDTERMEWETYTVQHVDWFAQGVARQQRFNETDNATTTNTTTAERFSQQIYKLDLSTPIGKSVADQAPFYFPIWQRVPLDARTINLNMLSSHQDHDHDDTNNNILAIQHMMSTGEAVLAGMQDVTHSKPQMEHIQFLLRYPFQEDPSLATNRGDPISTLLYPVFDTFDVETHQLVAMYSTTIYWPAIFHQIIIPSSGPNNAVIAVLKNNCDNVMTYQVNHDQSIYLGPDNVHDSKFDSLEWVYDMAVGFATDTTAGLRGRRDNAPKLATDFCPYTLHIYPSEEFHQAHARSSLTAFILAGSVAAWFVLASLAVVTYVRSVQCRMEPILKMERQADAVLSSQFPEAFRDRLLLGGKEGKTKNKKTNPMIHPKMRLQSYLTDEPVLLEGGHSGQAGAGTTRVVTPQIGMLGRGNHQTSDQRINGINNYVDKTKVIAELFPYCTVMFAGIPGFDSWSSERQPEQVFMLLEAIFQAFDEIARKLHVFKVESIGDIYVAVTGLPERQEDHAVRMTRFARQCLITTSKVTKKLERTLGPDTGDLCLRIGLNSGQVTAGVLQGQKARFQIFGDTVNMAARMQSTGYGNRIQLSESTANLLTEAKKQNWVKRRHDQVNVKGKGIVQTYWLIHGAQRDDMSVASARSKRSSLASSNSGADDADNVATGFEDAFDTWDDGKECCGGGVFTLPPMSKTAKKKRLVSWLVDALSTHVKRIVAQRQNKRLKNQEFDIASAITKGAMVKDEVVEAFNLPRYNKTNRIQIVDPELVVLDPAVIGQLNSYVAAIADLYKDNHFHNFEHASHVTLSSIKILKRIVGPEDVDYTKKSAHVDLHDTTYGIASDELAQFAVSLSALIHDVDHRGVPNGQLAMEEPELAKKYKRNSVAEQNSIDIAWDMLMDPVYKDLQECIFANEKDVQRFRQYIVNLVMATDIFDKDMTILRNKRWDKAFDDAAQASENASLSDSVSVVTSKTQWSNLPEKANLKATIVLEHIIQASDVSHTMQHWNIYKKWNERLFQEMYAAYDAGRAEKDPSIGWYGGEIWFFDNYVLPLAKKLDTCGVFGVSSHEFLNYAQINRKEWEAKGHDVVQEMVQRYKKRKNLEMGGFTPEEINCFTPKELEHILQLLIKKGRMFGSFLGTDINGQRTAAQAWLDALEIHERAPASSELPDPTLVFPVFSGMLVFLKGGVLVQDSTCSFEKKIAEKFVRDAEDLGDPVHFTRALAMLCEVQARSGDCQAALETFAVLDSEYEVALHHEGICKNYGTDRAAHAYSQAALWHHQLGNEKRAIEACEYVIASLLPKMDPKNILNSCELLLPVVRILCAIKGENKRMRDLFHQQVVQNFEKYEVTSTPCRPILKPLILLLDMRHDPDNFVELGEAVDWLLEEENGMINDFLDNIYVKLGLAPNTITAELCLCMAKELQKRNGDLDKVGALVRKGCEAARKAAWKMHDEQGNVILPIAWQVHEPVKTELFQYAKSLGLEEEANKIDPSVSLAAENMTPLKTSFGVICLKG